MKKITIGLPIKDEFGIHHLIKWFRNHLVEINKNPIKELK